MTKIFIAIWLLWLGIYDVRYKKVPIWLVMIGTVGVLIQVGYKWSCANQGIAGVIFGMFPGFVLLGIALITRQAGWIDGVITMLLGAAVGGKECFTAVMIGLLLLSVVALGLLFFKRANGKAKIPFIPFLLSGYLLAEMIGGSC